MKVLSAELVTVVRAALSGAKLRKFDESVSIINQSVELGGWVPRGSVKSNSGFYQGITRVDPHHDYEVHSAGCRGRSGNGSCCEAQKAQDEVFQLSMSLNYGHGADGIDIERAIKTLRASTERNGKPVKVKLEDAVIRAWVMLCREKNEAVEDLTIARPVPQITPIGLSPRVTATLKEMNLDLDISTIKLAKIAVEYYWDVDEKTGKQVRKAFAFVVWTKGIVHRQSRFASGCNCEACGKRIPSQRFVPVEAQDQKTNKLVSLWLGEDCARNIFGIKAQGVDPNAKK